MMNNLGGSLGEPLLITKLGDLLLPNSIQVQIISKPGALA